MKSPDPASLQNLNDIVLPTPESWWPLASGWYVLFGLLLIGLVWFSYKVLRRWVLNRYRRAALQELQMLSEGMQSSAQRDTSLRQIPILLKRTALSVYPRGQVASLSGDDWHRFLNSKLNSPKFTGDTANTLENIAYSTGDLGSVDSHSATELMGASKYWLQHHQTPVIPKDSKET